LSAAPDLSLVVACYNEAEVLAASFSEVRAVLLDWGRPFEIIFVDDVSRDRTREILASIERDNPAMDITVILHERNRGRGATVTDGAVGTDVRGVTIHAGALTVQATVENGHYAAWWPGSAFDRGPLDGEGHREPRLNLHYDLSLADGSVLLDVEPTRPA